MMSFLLVLLVGGALIWMLFPRTLGVASNRSYLRPSSTGSGSGWWGWGSGSFGGYPGGTAHSSHSTDCSSGISSDGGGSCGGGDGG